MAHMGERRNAHQFDRIEGNRCQNSECDLLTLKLAMTLVLWKERR